MKTFKILICTLLILSQIQAQNEKPVFRRGYSRLGISTLGNALDNNLSPAGNVFNGNYGAGTGFVAERGAIFYFRPKNTTGKINYGLDWTIFSATYNKLDKWNSYANTSQKTYNTNGKNFSISVASKIGPVVSFNPVEKLVIDARFQVAGVARVTPFEYYEDENNASARSFAFYTVDEGSDDDGSGTFKSMLATGIGSNVGITIRRGTLGLALDYTSAKLKTNYDAYESGNHTYGSQKIPTHSLQLKLSLTF